MFIQLDTENCIFNDFYFKLEFSTNLEVGKSDHSLHLHTERGKIYSITLRVILSSHHKQQQQHFTSNLPKKIAIICSIGQRFISVFEMKKGPENLGKNSIKIN